MTPAGVALRVVLTLLVFVPTAWAFASGQMLLAIAGVAASGWVFWKLFLSRID